MSGNLCPACGNIATVTDVDGCRTVECDRCRKASVTITTTPAMARAFALTPTIETYRNFYERHPRWLRVQLVLWAAGLVVGVVGLIASTEVAVAGFFVSAILGGVAIVLPSWRMLVTERDHYH